MIDNMGEKIVNRLQPLIYLKKNAAISIVRQYLLLISFTNFYNNTKSFDVLCITVTSVKISPFLFYLP